MSNDTITLEMVEALAAQIEADEAAQADRLKRLIKAEARIAQNRQPEKFRRRATRKVSGDSDGSYPPDVEYQDYSGPKSLLVRKIEDECVRTSSGFYYDYRISTAAPGLCVGTDGAVYLAAIEGTGHFGQFPAHPGDCDIDAEITFDRASLDSLDLPDLREIESSLRQVAFPHAAMSN